jgi:flagellar basal body-associated protein FliL
MLLWGGLAALAASGGVLTSFEAPPLISALLYLAMVSGWLVAGCGMVGYMRWFFRQSAEEARRAHTQPPKE